MKNIVISEFIPESNVDHMNMLLPAFLEIWNAEENLKYLSPTLEPFDEQTVRGWLKNHKKQGGRYFCAMNGNGEILGISVIKTIPTASFEIFGLGIRIRHKRRGIGRKLIGHAIRLASEHGYRSVDVSVFSDNLAMLRVLDALDFEPIGKEYRKRADGTDIVLMRRYLKQLHRDGSHRINGKT